MSEIKSLSVDVPTHDLKLLGSTPYVYHCHHFNLFHDQTVEDALGEAEGFKVRSRAARNSARQLLQGLIKASGATTPVERLQLATTIFSWMGHGSLELQTQGDGGSARGDYLHYSFAWREKYGSKVRRNHPIDAFAAGFAAAATEVAFDLTPESLSSGERSCFACREPSCEFEIVPVEPEESLTAVGKSALERHVRSPRQRSGRGYGFQDRPRFERVSAHRGG